MPAQINVPTATYRLQLNQHFAFAQVRGIIPYLRDLGVSHVYLSPILKARPGSTHGYDTVDHHQINPELGTLDDFRSLAAELKQAGLGILLDFVPNHMGVGGAVNALWLDVLQHGSDSRYADWFDIDWAVPDPRLRGKILVPFLGQLYAEALCTGEIELKAEADSIAIWAHGEHKMPLRLEDERTLKEHYGSFAAAAEALNGNPGEAGSWLALDSLIEKQHWRLAHFMTAADEINYRRFFINSDLAGIRIDRPEVFEHAHRLIFSLVEDGLIDGLRIDHVDGLLDPKAYLQELADKAPRPLYLLVEKILAPHEHLRADWPVHGTTGYEFGAQLTRLLTNPAGEAALTDLYQAFTGNQVSFPDETYLCKQRIMDRELAAELSALSRCANALAHSVLATADLTENGIRKGLREIIAWLPVYRTYLDGEATDPQDRREIDHAVAKSRRAQPAYSPAVFDFLHVLLTNDLSAEYDPSDVLPVIGRFQQYTGPVMAKGLEDTALYRYNRLVSLNDVGAHPDRFSADIASFHDANARRLVDHPATMLTTSTHDTKRGEDTRARISSIADQPDLWAQAVFAWRDLLKPDDQNDIDDNDLYLFFQLLLGGWPAGATNEQGVREALTHRLQEAMVKSVREARISSDWSIPNIAYEETLRLFISRAMSNPAFIDHFLAVEAKLSDIGWRRGLILAALKLTVPGVPDIYRGAEDWEQSFVDPDNRRFLDFSALHQRLKQLPAVNVARQDAKLALTRALLRLRRAEPDLFRAGTYDPIDTVSLLGFRRTHLGRELVVLADLATEPSPTIPEAALTPGRSYADILQGGTAFDPNNTTLGSMGVAVLFSSKPTDAPPSTQFRTAARRLTSATSSNTVRPP